MCMCRVHTVHLLAHVSRQLVSSTRDKQLVLLFIDLGKNTVTCGDIGLCVCLPVCVGLPLAAACCIQLVLTVSFFLSLYRISQRAGS